MKTFLSQWIAWVREYWVLALAITMFITQCIFAYKLGALVDFLFISVAVFVVGYILFEINTIASAARKISKYLDKKETKC